MKKACQRNVKTLFRLHESPLAVVWAERYTAVRMLSSAAKAETHTHTHRKLTASESSSSTATTAAAVTVCAKVTRGLTLIVSYHYNI